MRLIDLKCPSCGAALRIDMEAQQAFCPHCGHQLIVDDGRFRADSRSFRDAGYQFEQGRMQAQREQGASFYAPPQPAYMQPVVQDPRALAEARRQQRITRLTRWVTVIAAFVFFFNALVFYRMDHYIALGGAVAFAVFVIWSHRFNGFLRFMVIALMSVVFLTRLIL